jgi:pimeloyl-ACP methyl ester carboxylesterase
MAKDSGQRTLILFAYNSSMPFRLKVSLAIFLALLSTAFFVPFIYPVPPLENTVAERELAESDSLFIDVNDVTLHYKDTPAQTESDLTFIMLHGFGSALFTWDAVTKDLTQYGRVIAFDRPGFGLTERPLRGSWTGENPYSPQGQMTLLLGLMDTLNIDRAILVGNSAGGTIATQVALEKSERVAGLVLVDAAIYAGGGAPAWVRPILYTPQMSRLGPYFMRQIAAEPGENFIRSAWSNPDNIPAELWEDYRKSLRVNHWDKALWELTKASRRPNFVNRLSSLNVPTLVLSGVNDNIVPVAQSQRLASDIPGATFETFPNCGHTPQDECPDVFVKAIGAWLAEKGL